MMELTLSDVGTLCGYAGTIWCIANLGWAILRNDAYRALIYGIGCFAALIVALNVGGVLNEDIWSMFGCAVFGVHFAAVLWQQVWWKVPFYGAMLAASLLALLGVVRCPRCSWS